MGERSRFNGFLSLAAWPLMSAHSYSKLWVHVVWSTLDREPMLTPEAGTKCAGWLHSYASGKGIFLKACHFNADHVHALIDLPTGKSIEEVLQLFKGASSHWINEQRLVQGRFAWGRGYGVFSVSESNLAGVVAYIGNQEEHHRQKSFNEELRRFVERHGLGWQDEQSR